MFAQTIICSCNNFNIDVLRLDFMLIALYILPIINYPIYYVDILMGVQLKSLAILCWTLDECGCQHGMLYKANIRRTTAKK